MKIADRTFYMLLMQGATRIFVVYPFIIVVMQKLNCCGMNKQPQQNKVLNIFSKKFQIIRR